MATIPTTDLADLGIEAVSGRARDVRERLKGAQDYQIAALKLAHGDKDVILAFAETMRLIAPMIVHKLADRQSAMLEKLVDALVPTVPPPKHLLTEARMNAQARTAVLESAEWLTAAQLSEVAGFSGQNASAQPNKWKREGRIFAIRRGGNDYYPAYGLDPDAEYRPVKGLAPVLAVFGEELDAWDIAIWFASANGFLGGAAPMSLLVTDPDRVLAAAHDEMAGIAHG